MQVIKYVFQPHGDERGQLVALEEFKDIPFEIKRVYYMYDTAEGVTRGYHAHKCLQQILICIHGSCKIRLDNGKEKKVVPLEKPYEGLYVSNNMWRYFRLHKVMSMSELSTRTKKGIYGPAPAKAFTRLTAIHTR